MKFINSSLILVLIVGMHVNLLKAEPPIDHLQTLKQKIRDPAPGALKKAAASVDASFTIEATWIGSPQWMSGVNYGFEAFGGSIAKGVDFLGSNIQTNQYVPVEIKFDTLGANWTLCQTFRRPGFYSKGVGTFPGSAWDISDTTNPRRLNVCFVEFDTIPAPDFKWNPDGSEKGKYEFLLIMNSNYDGTGATYAGTNALLGNLDVLYGWWPRVAPGHIFLESIPSSLLVLPRINFKALQTGYDVNLKWFCPGPPPDHFELYMGLGAFADSLLATLGPAESAWTHLGVVPELNYHYLISSFSAAGNKVLSSREVSLLVRALPPINSVFPAAQAIRADTLTDLVVTFNSVMNPATINSSTFKVFGHWSGPRFGIYQMENGNTRVRFIPEEPFSAGEWVLASLTKSIETINGTNLPSGYAWSFWIKTKPSSLNMVEIEQIDVRAPGEGLVQCYGAYGGDINDDGYSDISVINEIADDVRVFLNDGSGGFGSFTVYPFADGSVPSPNDGADFNSDGNIDMAVGATSSDQLIVILGNGSGGFAAPAYYTTGYGNWGVAVLDLNGDGHADIATSNWGADKVYTLLNNGDGTFAPAKEIETGSNGEFPCASGDANNDGILDLFVGTWYSGEMVLLLGDGNGGFNYSNKVSSGGAETWMIATGDINRDANIDAACVNFGGNNASVFFGDGLGGLSDPVVYPTTQSPMAIDLGDIDGDGDLEMVTSSYAGAMYRVFENDGSGNYINPKDYPAVWAASCITLHDRNRDGRMDMTGIDEVEDIIILFESSCCNGLKGDLNSDGRNCNILDLNFLVNFIFRGSGNPGDCPQESDVNGDDSIPNILDLNYVVNFIFRGGSVPPACP